MTEGIRFGAGIRQMQEQRLEAERVRQQQEQLQTEFSKLRQNPNPTWEDYESVAMLLPKDAAESLRKNFEVRSAQEQNQEKLFTGQVAAALSSPNEDSRKIGIDRLRRRAEAERNAGNEDKARAYEVHAQIAEVSPDGAKTIADEMITFGASVFGKDWTESIVRGREAPVQMAKNVAEAKSAAVKADFAESAAVMELGLKQAQIDNYAAQQDIARQNVRIAALNAQIAQESNVLKRRELEQRLADAQVERDDKLRKKVSDANNAFANFDNFLNTADRALAGWEKDKAGKIDIKKPKGYVKSATGPISTRLPTLSQDTADFEELIESLKSQAFLTQVEKMKGLGALSEKEGAALQAALTNLSLRQSPEQLGRNLMEAQRLILKGRDEAARKYGVGAAPDRPAGPGGAAPAQVPGAAPAAAPTAAPPAAPAMPSGFRVLGRE